ncbi:MAG: DUF262 domain-containing protein [Proteobacteria bacterium]|nr:DUF262 domain-containing protein [Pseudomonadota bacterium]
MSDLKSLSEIFEHKLIRIPDYQRGYAWQSHELKDFWEDLNNLAVDRVHYTGVITLEPVSEDNFSHWQNDLWLIEGLGYKPFYVVDGQQRLTTSLILIQAILESIKPEEELNYQSPEAIKKQYVMQMGNDGLRRSFLFGYEKDNPSDEFLKTQVFNETSCTNNDQLTLYTKNLADAKAFFLEELATLSLQELETVFKKLTQKFKFNLYVIDDEIDVFVTFETMNNRGKQLSSLELLKNRLIYLSTLFHDNEGHQVLRTRINESWKTIYEYLGKHPEKPLSDNLFLRNHWTMYFKYSRLKGDDYIKFLLDEKFTAKNVTHPDSDDDKITMTEIEEYVSSLQKAVKPWFYIHNPYEQVAGYDNDENKVLLNRLERLSFRSFKPLILAAFCSDQEMQDINKLLRTAERYNFTLFTLSQRRGNTGDTEFFSAAQGLLSKTTSIEDVISNINVWIGQYCSPKKFSDHVKEKFEVGHREGFYRWDGLRYFLFEYEDHLQKKGKQARRKLDWQTLSASQKDHVTVEHIYPQTETDEWAKCFSDYTTEQKHFITHSLGNLLPLSRAKNSALQNNPFELKKNNGEGVGYYNGSISENEVAQNAKWAFEEILTRGLELLNFLEERWEVSLGDEQFKKELLCLSFDTDDQNGRVQ